MTVNRAETRSETTTSRALFSGRGLAVVHHRCNAGPGDRPFAEAHRRHALALVQRGSFGYCCQGRRFELAAGSVMVGHPGDEYVCSHEHHATGDDCLSFQFDAALADEAGAGSSLWHSGALAPDASLAVLGGLASAIAKGRSDVAWDELGLMLAERLRERIDGEAPKAPSLSPAARRRVVQAALWLDEHAHEAVELADVAKAVASSPFHLLRQFSRVFGVTPHQYLIRCRLRRAAVLLADDEASVTDVAYAVGFGDLSNFVRTFGRAAGVSPSRFAALPRAQRKFVQAARPLPA
jgi:AraC-like DNA-binding protein